MNKKWSLFRMIIWAFIALFLIAYFFKLISGENLGFNIPIITGSLGGDYEVICEKTDNIQGINSIEVSLTSDEVNVINTSDENIKVVQYSRRELDEDKYVNLVRDGDKLKISVPRQGIIYFGFGESVQKFNIYIPEKYNNKLSISHTSGKCNVDNLTLSELKLKMTSGKIVANNIKADDLYSKLTSGQIEIQGEFKNMDVEISSGKIVANNIKVDNLKSKVTSGKIEVQGEFKDIEVGVSSGKAEIESVNLPENLSVEVTSGKCELSLPENEGFNLKYKRTSGSIKTDFELENFDSSNRSGLAKYKAGGNEWYVKVTSGSVEFDKN